MTNDPPDPAFLPTGCYDEAAINRARNLLDAMPENVGPYRILERLGGGGMGEVYRAEQRAPIRRDVALKFIKLGMDTRLVIARFEAERQALALMDHPHIAKVFDAGMDDTGRPYFVMEYVKGKPITEYADQNHLSISERLELLEQVCQAVQHAHHKGVIHRDLKPSNVLVSTQDGRPFAKVIDFGVAKAIARRLTDHTLFTEHDQFVGTPEYMSPEQAEGSVDIDTRTDVYSLGVMLYELLTGSTPFSSQELKAAAFEQIKKMIVEVDPPKPSTRLTLGQPTLSTLAASRRTEPKRLGTLVRGELDWIVMKALDKDRKRRYETPTSLANDIQAHLKGEPVQAAPPSAAYRIRKFVRKHRGPVVAVAMVGTVLLLGVIGTSWGYYRAERNAQLERDAKDRESVARQEATEQRNAATTAREKAVAAQDQAEGALARGFMRPLVGDDFLTPLEIEPLWELATMQSNTIGLRMLDEATRNPQTTTQLLNCAQPILGAAIGLNPDLRRRALALLRPRLGDQALTLDHRAAIAWVTLMLLDQPGPDSAVCVAVIKEAIATENRSPSNARSYAYEHSDRVVALVPPEAAAELLLASIAVHERWFYVPDLANALAALSARLPPDAAAQICESASAPLMPAIADPKRTRYDLPLAGALVALSAHLHPEAAARIFEPASATLLAAIADPERTVDDLSKLARAVVALSARLEPDAAARICESASAPLLAAIADPKRTRYSPAPPIAPLDLHLAKDLVALSAHLDPEAAARIFEPASAALLAAIANPKLTRDVIWELTDLLAALSARLEAETAARACGLASDSLLAAIADPEQNAYHLDGLARALVALSARLEPEAAARISGLASDSLLAALTDPQRTARDLSSLAHALVALSARLPPDAAARDCESASAVLLAAIADPEQNFRDLITLAHALVALSARLPPDAAARDCESASAVLLAAIADPEQNFRDLITLAYALVALSARLEPEAAARACEAMWTRSLAAIADPEQNADHLFSLAEPLVALSARLEPEAAARVCESIRLLAVIADPEQNAEHLKFLANSVAMLSAHLQPEAAARVCELVSNRLLTAIAHPKRDATDFCRIAYGVASLAERLEPGRAKITALRAICSVTEEQLMSSQSGSYSDGLIESMAMVSRHLAPPLRKAVFYHLLALRLERPDGTNGMGGGIEMSERVTHILTVMQWQEPHHAAMVTPSDHKDVADVSNDPVCSTLKLTTPEIVEFLKFPVTPGVHRRALLDLLECRYGRRFGNQWAFVEYAQAENLGLDFTTRVKRPDPKATLKAIHKLIDDELAKL